MAKRISLSRAARLVGVKRGTLQQKIRAGELATFEGEIVLADLLQAYPETRVEDSSMLERVEQIIEQATFVNPEHIARRPDNVALTTRVMSLSRELARQRRQLRGYRHLTAELAKRIQGLQAENASEIAAWLKNAEAEINDEDDIIDQNYINETYLRVMSAQATVIPSGHEFFVEGAESLLEAGLRGGLALNYGCSNGNCGLCKMRVVSGEVRRIRHHDYALSEAEKGLGYMLGCCNTAITDVVLEADEARGIADIPKQRIPLRIRKIERASDEVLIVSTRTPRTSRLRFLAGQGASLSIDGIGSSFYPIASCPCDDMNLQFHITRDPRDALAIHLDTATRTNEQIDLEGPEGSFVLNENSPHSLVFIAEGIGFASIKGLIEHAMALDAAEHIYLFWIAGDSAPYLHNLCRAWNDALDNFYYSALQSGDDIAARVAESLESQDAARLDYYACGSAELCSAIEDFIDDRSIPRSQFTYQTIQPMVESQS